MEFLYIMKVLVSMILGTEAAHEEELLVSLPPPGLSIGETELLGCQQPAFIFFK